MDELNLDGYLVEDTTPAEEPQETGPDTETKPEAETETRTEDARTETEPAEAEPVEFKHNHQSVELDRQAAQTIAQALGMDTRTLTATLQKGADYDIKVSKLADIEKTLDSYARQLNIDRQGVFGLLDAAADRVALKDITGRIRLEHPDWTDDAVEEHSRLLLSARKQEQEQQFEAGQREQEQEANRPLVEFFMRHPEITADSLPDEVARGWSEDGLSIEEAYLSYQNKQKDMEIENLKTELAKAQKDAQNREKSIGSVGSEIGGEVGGLDEAFFSAFN